MSNDKEVLTVGGRSEVKDYEGDEFRQTSGKGKSKCQVSVEMEVSEAGEHCL